MNLIKHRLEGLRAWLRANGYHACVIPQTDPHLSEYVEEYDKVRTHFSGFTGSAGTLVVTLTQAALFTDSRYYVQAEQQLAQTDIDWCKQDDSNGPTIATWLKKQLSMHQKVAANAYYFAHHQWQALMQEVTMQHETGFEQLWQDRPMLSVAPIRVYQGPTPSMAQKMALLRNKMQQKGVDACFITALDDIAWLLNIRGDDIAYVPVARSYLWVDATNIIWWVDTNKAAHAEMAEYLNQNKVQILPYQNIEQTITCMPAVKTVWVDAAVLNQRMYTLLQSAYTLYDSVHYATEAKACKTPVELTSIAQVMEYDAVAWVRSLQWLDTQLEANNPITELDFQATLLAFKKQHPCYWGESFAPIVAYGAHGAIVHYEATKQSNAPILPQGFLLVDAGSHYTYGTTDVTRTICCGMLTAKQKQVYTAVLQGMIAMARAQFTTQTPSTYLDKLARAPLNALQLQYGHGTGHGIGTVLSVHERGVRISPACVKPLQVGMVLSDEPGCYLKDHFGVRIENMLAVQEAACLDACNKKEKPLQFWVLTCIPLDCRAMDVTMLSDQEKTWINTYHRWVCSTIKPYLTTTEYNWLKTYVYEI